ncbi:TIGR04282 family arsenosugar biosynthesis glycosyltransferase [Thiohalobacter sp. IOR34]|uniref:TIGR04282 family arsenosugar biosynthesis glycosyltransferase n=1 Tax=Thiohalobacter sp. IOR34 TaxID=3057176 RepID=UPI0025AEE1FE|nr:TIGR04282 family arsenosugar biosynthesis glycosyltransferase [Thiohalobacter sp. IOR34]WJW76511.1 TIGR04282 family arsenosugar biosynthesis glycosyltransferase [Thiohalobacter sp. IOR34]
MSERGSLLLFARAPRPGQCKTRLIPALGAEGAAALQARLLEQTLEAALASGVAPLTLCASPPQDPLFARLARRPGVALRGQGDGDLGARMAAAFGQALEAADWALLIGSDCPVLDADYLRSAARALRSGADAVLGPAEDGGYVLIGLRRSAPPLFAGIPWGGESVLDITRRRLDDLGWRRVELETLWDVDRPEDLPRLRRSQPHLLP